MKKQQKQSQLWSSPQWNTPEGRTATLARLKAGQEAYWTPERRAEKGEALRRWRLAEEAAHKAEKDGSGG